MPSLRLSLNPPSMRLDYLPSLRLFLTLTAVGCALSGATLHAFSEAFSESAFSEA